MTAREIQSPVTFIQRNADMTRKSGEIDFADFTPHPVPADTPEPEDILLDEEVDGEADPKASGAVESATSSTPSQPIASPESVVPVDVVKETTPATSESPRLDSFSSLKSGPETQPVVTGSPSEPEALEPF